MVIDGSAFAATVIGGDEIQSYEAEPTWYSDGWHDWVWHDDEWHTYYGDGWVVYSEMKPWLDVEDIAAVNSVAGKEVEELFVNFQQKVRTFREAIEIRYTRKGRIGGTILLFRRVNRKERGKPLRVRRVVSHKVLWQISQKGKDQFCLREGSAAHGTSPYS